MKEISYVVARDAPAIAKVKRAVHLLPGFDECLLGYTDRRVALDEIHAPAFVPGNNGMFMPTIVAGGRVVGKWRAPTEKGRRHVTLEPFEAMSTSDARAAARSVKRYERFVSATEQ